MSQTFFDHHHADHMPHKAVRIARWVLLGLVLATVFALVLGFLVAWLWNAVMPPVFGLGEIGYWQAVGLLILAKLFFGGKDHHEAPHFVKKWKRSPGSDAPHETPASIPDLPAEQQEIYRRYWDEQGKAAFEAYVNDLQPDPSKE